MKHLRELIRSILTESEEGLELGQRIDFPEISNSYAIVKSAQNEGILYWAIYNSNGNQMGAYDLRKKIAISLFKSPDMKIDSLKQAVRYIWLQRNMRIKKGYIKESEESPVDGERIDFPEIANAFAKFYVMHSHAYWGIYIFNSGHQIGAYNPEENTAISLVTKTNGMANYAKVKNLSQAVRYVWLEFNRINSKKKVIAESEENFKIGDRIDFPKIMNSYAIIANKWSDCHLYDVNGYVLGFYYSKIKKVFVPAYMSDRKITISGTVGNVDQAVRFAWIRTEKTRRRKLKGDLKRNGGFPL